MLFLAINRAEFEWLLDSILKLDVLSISALSQRKNILKRLNLIQRLQVCRVLDQTLETHKVAKFLKVFLEQDQIGVAMELLQVEPSYFKRFNQKYFPNIYQVLGAPSRIASAKIWIELLANDLALSLHASMYVLDKVPANTEIATAMFETLFDRFPKNAKIRRRYVAWSIKKSYLLGQSLAQMPAAHEVALSYLKDNQLDVRELKLLSQIELDFPDSDLHALLARNLTKLVETGASDTNSADGFEADIDPEIFLSSASLQAGDEGAWSHAINHYFDRFVATAIRVEPGEETLFNRIQFENIMPKVAKNKKPLVSVIMPSFNNGKLMARAIQSILDQTWQNFELIIIDDCSEDDSFDIAQEFAANDKRVTALRNRTNCGPYICRNRGLQMAKGVFVTVNDSDDISLPARLQIHVEDLLGDSRAAIANYSQLLRVCGNGRLICDLIGRFKRMNSSSIMFRRKPVLAQVGYWDSVRFGADSEMFGRMKAVFGKQAITLLDVPLMLCHYASENLTSQQDNVLHGMSGNRKAYKQNFDRWHKKLLKEGLDQPLEMAQQERRFPAPAVMVVPAVDTAEYTD